MFFAVIAVPFLLDLCLVGNIDNATSLDDDARFMQALAIGAVVRRVGGKCPLWV